MIARHKQKKIWVIEGGEEANDDFLNDSGLLSNNVKIYRISEIGKYLLSPEAIEVEERLIGYTLHFKQPKWNLFQQKMTGRLPFLRSFRPT